MCEDTVQHILSLFSGLLTPIIAIIAVYIAWQQYKTNQRRLHLEKYDRRLAVYAEIKKILSLIMRDADVSTEELVRFRTATAQADFLFGEKIRTYIDEVYRKGLKLWETNVTLREAELSREQRQQLAEEHSDALRWFASQFSSLSGKFSPYLSLSD